MKTLSLPLHSAIVDGVGNIVSVSENWDSLAGVFSSPLPDTGKPNYFYYCLGNSSKASIELLGHVQALLSGKTTFFSALCPFQRAKETRWIFIIGVSVADDKLPHGLLHHIDVSDILPAGFSAGSANPLDLLFKPATLPQDSLVDALRSAFSQAISSGRAATPDRRPPLERTPAPQPAIEDAEFSLTARQKQVLALMAAGKSNSEISKELSCSLHTVKTHVVAILQRLNVGNRTEAAMIAARIFSRDD